MIIRCSPRTSEGEDRARVSAIRNTSLPQVLVSVFLLVPFYYCNRRLLLAPATYDDLLLCFRTNGAYSLANGTWYIEAQRPSSLICILDLEVQLALFSVIQLLDTGVYNIYIRLESQ